MNYKILANRDTQRLDSNPAGNLSMEIKALREYTEHLQPQKQWALLITSLASDAHVTLQQKELTQTDFWLIHGEEAWRNEYEEYLTKRTQLVKIANQVMEYLPEAMNILYLTLDNYVLTKTLAAKTNRQILIDLTQKGLLS